MSKVSVFLDLSDLYHRVKRKFNGKIDFEKLSTFVKCGIHGFVDFEFHAYGIERHDEAKRFATCLQKLGFQTQFKRPHIWHFAGREYTRANWEIGIACDIMACQSEVIVLGSGNSEFKRLLELRGCWILSCDISKALSEKAFGILEITQEHLCSETS